MIIEEDKFPAAPKVDYWCLNDTPRGNCSMDNMENGRVIVEWRL